MWYKTTSALTVSLQQLLLGRDGERAVFGRQHHSQADVVLLRGGGPTDDGQQPHGVGLRSSTETLHAEPGGVAQAWRRREQALAWRRTKEKRGRFPLIRIISMQWCIQFCNGTRSDHYGSVSQCWFWSSELDLQDPWLALHQLVSKETIWVVFKSLSHVLG